LNPPEEDHADVDPKNAQNGDVVGGAGQLENDDDHD
jgi:hypothetical protein